MACRLGDVACQGMTWQGVVVPDSTTKQLLTSFRGALGCQPPIRSTQGWLYRMRGTRWHATSSMMRQVVPDKQVSHPWKQVSHPLAHQPPPAMANHGLATHARGRGKAPGGVGGVLGWWGCHGLWVGPMIPPPHGLCLAVLLATRPRVALATRGVGAMDGRGVQTPCGGTPSKGFCQARGSSMPSPAPTPHTTPGFTVFNQDPYT